MGLSLKDALRGTCRHTVVIAIIVRLSPKDDTRLSWWKNHILSQPSRWLDDGTSAVPSCVDCRYQPVHCMLQFLHLSLNVSVCTVV